MSDSNVALNELDVIIFDFDGVFTDNTVYLSADGIEMLRFSKSDSLGLDLFREHLLNRQLNLELLILTKEKSPVVAHRAQKLKLNLIQDVSDKWGYISGNLSISPDRYAYFGNDLNDLEAMQNARVSFAPSDAHPRIIQVASRVLEQRGGQGFVRAGLELLMENN